MRIATLQFAPRLGDIQENFARANGLLDGHIASLERLPRVQGSVEDLTANNANKSGPFDLLVLPELAFTGYNFPSLKAILPYLEPTASGPSTRWAQDKAKQYGCIVSVGYPELYSEHNDSVPPTSDPSNLQANGNSSAQSESHASVHRTIAYNALATVAPSGKVLAHYRKTHLHYTDEMWAEESPQGFFSTSLPLQLPTTTSSTTTAASSPASETKVAWGICMDLNNYRFQAPWTKYEYASAALAADADMLVVSMAWLSSSPPNSPPLPATRPPPPHPPSDTHTVAANSHPDRNPPAETLVKQKHEPDLQTLTYWLNRFDPLLHHDQRSRIVVCANRCGSEPGENPLRPGEQAGVIYAGTSWIGWIGRGRVEVWAVMGRGEEGVCVADLDGEGVPERVFKLRSRGESRGRG